MLTAFVHNLSSTTYQLKQLEKVANILCPLVVGFLIYKMGIKMTTFWSIVVVNAYKVCETVTGTYFIIIIIIAVFTITEMTYAYLHPFINSVSSWKALKIMFLFCFDFKKPRVKFWENFSNFYGMRVYNLCLNFLLISTFKVHLNFFWLFLC